MTRTVFNPRQMTFTFPDAQNMAFGTTTGTKIGTSTTQKIGLWNVTPVVQPSAIADSTGTTGSNTTTINAILAALRAIGAISV